MIIETLIKLVAKLYETIINSFVSLPGFGTIFTAILTVFSKMEEIFNVMASGGVQFLPQPYFGIILTLYIYLAIVSVSLGFLNLIINIWERVMP